MSEKEAPMAHLTQELLELLKLSDFVFNVHRIFVTLQIMIELKEQIQ